MGKLGHWEWNDITGQLCSCSEQYASIFDMTAAQMLTLSRPFEDEINEMHITYRT